MANVLLVDDSQVEHNHLKSLLEQHGHNVILAESGADGVALCRQETPDVVLMDIVLPGMNGFQATRQLSEYPMTRDIPVIILSSKDQEADRVWGIRQGAREYLTKPVDEAVLLDTLLSVTSPEPEMPEPETSEPA